MLPLQGPQVRSLVRELRSHKLHSLPKKKRHSEAVSLLIYWNDCFPPEICAVPCVRLLLSHEPYIQWGAHLSGFDKPASAAFLLPLGFADAVSSAWKHGPFLPFLPIASGSAPMPSPLESPSRPFSPVPKQTWARAPPVFPAMLQPALLEGQSQHSSSGFESVLQCLHAKSLQLYLTLCDPMDCSPPGFSVPGILRARMLEWVPFPSPRDRPDPGHQTFISYVSCIGRLALYH